MPHASHQPPAPEPPQKRAGSSDAPRRHGLIWDHTVFHVVASCRARPAMVAPSKRNCRIARAQTRPRCAHPLVMLQEYHRLAGGFAAYPAPLKPPEPCRDPGPGCVDHLHHHAPVALSDSARNPGTPPAKRSQDSMSSTRVSGVRATLIRWKPSKPTSRSHRSSDTQQQVGPDTARGPLKIAGVEVRSSSRTSTSTRNPRSTPTHPHSTRKSR